MLSGMSHSPQDAWFYSHEGERHGPVAVADLRAIAMAGCLDPRLDMVWTPGMAEWQRAGEIADLFERRVSDGEASTHYPYMPPQMESVAELMRRGDPWPGARRRAYLAASLLLPLMVSVALSNRSAMLTHLRGPAGSDPLTLGALLALGLISLYYGLQRLVNLGMNCWWFLGHFVPILNLWVGYRCFACPAGYAYHKKLGGTGIVLAIFYWLVVAAVIFVLVAVTCYGNEPRVAEACRLVRETLAHLRPTALTH